MDYLKGIKFQEGDIVFESGQISSSNYKETIKQIIESRLKTNNPDWFRHFLIGGDLEDLRGLDNTKVTAQKGVEKINRCLTYDGFIKEEELEIKAVPTSNHEITFFILVHLEFNENLTVVFPIDIE